MSEKVADIPDDARMQILTAEQTLISEMNPEELAKRVSEFEILIREARLRLQVNVTRRALILADKDEEEKALWRARSRKYKTDKAPAGEQATGLRVHTRKPGKSAYEKAVESMMKALGLSREEAEAHCLKLKK